MQGDHAFHASNETNAFVLAKQNIRNKEPTLPANAARHVATRMILCTCSYVSLSENLHLKKPPLRYT